MKTNTMTLTKAGTADLIATVWFCLGFKPSNSVVVVGLSGARNRVGMMIRADLPPPTMSRSQLREWVRELLEPVRTSGAQGMVALIADETVFSGPTPPLLSILRQQTRQGPALFDVVGVTSTIYRSLVCAERECCPREGRPLEAVMESRAAAMHVLAGLVVVDSEQDLLADVRPDPAPERESVAEAGVGAAVEWVDPFSADNPFFPDTRLSSGERSQWWQTWVEALGRVEAGAEDLPGREWPAGLAVALHDPFLREAVFLHLLGAAPDQVWLDGSGEVDGQGGERELGGADFDVLMSRPPDELRLGAGRAVLARAARTAAAGTRAPSLAMLALIAWYQGAGARARLLIDEARADDSDPPLIELVETMLVGRVQPPWMRISPYGG